MDVRCCVSPGSDQTGSYSSDFDGSAVSAGRYVPNKAEADQVAAELHSLENLFIFSFVNGDRS
jgi:hypothetical protein